MAYAPGMTSTPDWVERMQARMDDPDAQLGAHINALRGYKLCTQTQLGAVIGVNQSTMGRKLRGEVGISFRELLKLAEFFELSVEDLIPPQYAGEPKLRARRDSNPQPSDLEPAPLRLAWSVKAALTPNRTVAHDRGRHLQAVS